MDNLFTWFDSFFDEVITNVSEVPLNNFIIERDHQSVSGDSTLSSTSQLRNRMYTSFDYTNLSNSNVGNSDFYDPYEGDLDHETYDNHNGRSYFSSTSNLTTSPESIFNINTSTHNAFDDISDMDMSVSVIQENIVENANRLRVLQELYTQTVSNSSQNINYSYSINSTDDSSNLNFYTPPPIELPTQITDLLTLFFNDQLSNTMDSLEDVKVTLDVTKFDKLPEITFSDEIKIDEPCNICMEDYINNDILKKLPCNHYYHKDCISKWLCNEKTTCPMCRKDVRSAFDST